MTGNGEMWKREGLVLAPTAGHGWWISHAQAPTVLVLHDRLWRIYFAARDERPVSRILCADVDPTRGCEVVAVHPEPVLDLGAPGTFDSHGMGPATARMVDGRVHLYYTGIVRGADVPHHLAIGLAVSDGGLRFERAAAGPILSTGPNDPLLASTPFVRAAARGYEMWYVSGREWTTIDGRPEVSYGLRHTRSDDGKIWSLATLPAHGYGDGTQEVVGRSWVIDRGDRSVAFYSRRNVRDFRGGGQGGYRLWQGRIAADGRSVEECAPLAFANPPQPGDWDATMQAYPCVVPSGDDLVMLYNGDGFGRSGFGVARLEGGAV